MRYVFMDEAGTSAPEPVTVVVGLIANADQHVMRAEALVAEALGAVPEKFRPGFVFHATQVFGDKEFQKDWSLTDRLSLLYAMMSIPKRLEMAVCVSANWRNAVDYGDAPRGIGISAFQFDHLSAFMNCVAVCDRGLRQHAGVNEVAAIVAEDVPEMRRLLKRVPQMLREQPYHIEPSYLRRTDRDNAAGYSSQSGDLRVTRIRDAVHFVDKDADPLVQVADACAYGCRRYFAQEKFGDQFVEAIFGDANRLRNFASPGGVECYWPPATPAFATV